MTSHFNPARQTAARWMVAHPMLARRTVVCVIVAALGAVAVPAGAKGAKQVPTARTQQTGVPAFPAISVTEISSGQPFDLSTLANTNGKPTLVWFWAPH